MSGSDPACRRPTVEDLARDLLADLAYCRQFESTCRQPWWRGWPAAIRRALAAEAEVRRLQELTLGLTARVAAQAELLERRARRPGG